VGVRRGIGGALAINTYGKSAVSDKAGIDLLFGVHITKNINMISLNR